MQTRKQYILLETGISVLINVVLSIGFVYLIFRGQPHVATMGRHGIVLDMVPQTFMVALMGSLIPTLLTRRRLRARTLPWSETLFSKSSSPLFLLFSVALLTCALVVIVSWIVLRRLIPNGVDFYTLLVAKAIFGGLLALAVTPWAINRELH